MPSFAPGRRVLSRRQACLGALLLLTIPLALNGQVRDRWDSGGYSLSVEYGGLFTFTRIRYGASADLLGFGRGRSSWSHDYPRGDRHLSRILHDLTAVSVNVEETNVLDLDDAELFKHPLAYLSEPGFWTMSDDEARSLRSYLLKGGFLIFDDFEFDQWLNFEAQMRRVLPEHRAIEIDVGHPIFHCFFDMKSIDFPHPFAGVSPTYYGYFENNDPTERMLAVVNYNNDVAEYWEWSDTGYFPVDITNDAYKLGVNYVVYALTH